MSDPLLSAPYHPTYTSYRRGCIMPVALTFASGVPTIDTARSAPGFTIAGDTGVYTGTMPKSGRVLAWAQCFAANTDSFTANFHTIDPTGGTFAFNTFDLATPSAYDVATGNEVWLFFLAEGA